MFQVQQAASQVKEAEEEGDFSDDKTDQEEEQGEAETEEDEEQAMPVVARPDAKLKGQISCAWICALDGDGDAVMLWLQRLGLLCPALLQ